MASPKKRSDKRNTISRAIKYSSPQKNNARLGSSKSKFPKSRDARSDGIGREEDTAQMQGNLNVRSHAKKSDVDKVAVKNSNKLSNIRKKALSKSKGRTYILRSFDTGRMLRSMKNTANVKASQNQQNPPTVPENLVSKARKKGKMKVKKLVQDELSRIRKHIRYLLNRMNYELSLIDAYAGEGWKGQSAEKLRPEKELERARSEINRCKLKMREIFKQLDSLMAVGRLPESLFDPDGIYSENIFCGKCGSEEVYADNDIILCDGICERGFHQKCLNPPLLSEDIPAGEDEWLCPQCDCKVDCIDLLSEFIGMDLSIEDPWEKIFPEAAALENKDGQFDDLNLPSDDSEDDDYDPDAAGVGFTEQDEEPSYEASESSCSSEDSLSSLSDIPQATLELPSDDSEDYDYDPGAPDKQKEIQKGNSSSDESDFTSDSDEFCAELMKSTCADEATAFSLPTLEVVDSIRANIKDNDMSYNYPDFPSVVPNVDMLDGCLRTPSKRHSERLSCRKLYDEADNKGSCGSNNDEVCNGSTPKKMKIDAVANNAKKNRKSQTSIASYLAADNEHGLKKSHSGAFSPAVVGRDTGLASMGTAKLYELFRENEYPTREEKESLARELGMTLQQVTKWFGNTRHRFRNSAKKSSHASETTSDESQPNGFLVSAKKSSNLKTPTGDKVAIEAPTRHSGLDKVAAMKTPEAPSPRKATDSKGKTTHTADKKKLKEAFEVNWYPSMETKEKLAEELGMTLRQVSKWFDNARHSRSSSKAAMSDKAESPYSRTPTTHNSSYKIASRRSRTGHLKLNRAVNLESPGVRSANGILEEKVSTNNELESPAVQSLIGDFDERKTGIGADSSEDGSERKNNRDGGMQERNREKAIAKELRKMRSGR